MIGTKMAQFMKPQEALSAIDELGLISKFLQAEAKEFQIRDSKRHHRLSRTLNKLQTAAMSLFVRSKIISDYSYDVWFDSEDDSEIVANVSRKMFWNDMIELGYIPQLGIQFLEEVQLITKNAVTKCDFNHKKYMSAKAKETYVSKFAMKVFVENPQYLDMLRPVIKHYADTFRVERNYFWIVFPVNRKVSRLCGVNLKEPTAV